MQHQLHKVLKELRKARDQIANLESNVSVPRCRNSLRNTASLDEFCLMQRNVLCCRNTQALVSQSPAPTVSLSLSILLSMILHLHQRSPTYWMKVSWSAQSVTPPIPPAATGSSWLILTTALPELAQSRSAVSCLGVGATSCSRGQQAGNILSPRHCFLFNGLQTNCDPFRKCTFWVLLNISESHK